MCVNRLGSWLIVTTLIGLVFLGLAVGLSARPPAASAQGPGPGGEGLVGETAAPCPGGPVIDGVTLDECVVENFVVGGDNKSITVWYTRNVVTATRTVESKQYTLEHWISTTAQAESVAAWGREAWEQYHAIFGRHPYNNGCSDNINVRMEDGIGWGGIAYWASPGSCWIGIDSPKVRNGGGQWTVYHEFQHYLQYAYDAGCYASWKPHYPDNAEYVEGYADVSSDAVDAWVDSWGYRNAVQNYNPVFSMFDKGYGNVYSKYYLEQIGTSWTPADPEHHMDALRQHYEECDVQDTLYVLDTLIPTLKPGLTEEKLFLNFFAANWAKDWADPSTQPELVYTDDDGNSYGAIRLEQNVAMAGGSQSWNVSPLITQTWAGRYYQVRPQAGCDYVTVDVDGAGGATLGINLMAADTSAPTSVSRSAWMGEDFARTFAGHGVYDRIVAAVNAFAHAYDFDVTFTCVTPDLDILEPRQVNPVLVGSPTSPIAFLTRFEVTDGSTPVRGLPESSFSAEAEGDAVTIIPGSLQQVGDEYWATMIPPVKPAGTISVNLTICLDGTICDTETNALIYQDPGHTDFALVFDASGSMKTEDVIGEGARISNTKKAGTVLADLLRFDDRVLVMDFSAKDNPTGCGLPYGDGDCELDLKTYLARTDVISPANVTIAQVKNAIGQISARDWTPIGAALREAKNQLQAAPYSLNPKHIILLSDGEENVNPLYAAVQSELVASGVVIDTIGLSGEAPEPLLAQIAADTGGTYRFVPTTGGTMGALGTEASALSAEAQADRMAELQRMGLPAEVASRLLTPLSPGPLGLDDVYDYYETKGEGATRLFHNTYLGATESAWQTLSQYVDDSVNVLRLVSAGKQADYEAGPCGPTYRVVEVLRPSGDPKTDWIPIGHSDYEYPPNWSVRNSVYDDVAIITNPETGTWQMRTRYWTTPCQGREVEPDAPMATFDFMMNGSVQSDIRLQCRFLPPILDNQGLSGDHVPIVAALLKRTGTIPGATVLAAVEKPGGVTYDYVWLQDDGEHGDGAADDGIYGGLYGATDVGGSYNVRILAMWEDPVQPGNDLTREWLGSFWLQGPDPEKNDNDQDGMPDPWEDRCGLSTILNDAQGDLDRDGLSNIGELVHGTLPCDPDTDDGGERDGSEVEGGRNPLEPSDDLVRPLGRIRVYPLNGRVVIRWTHPLSFTAMWVYTGTHPDEPGGGTNMGTGGIYTLTLPNDRLVYLILSGESEGGQGGYTAPIPVIPRADPDPPNGAVLINNDAMTTTSQSVILNVSGTDTPLPGPATPASGRVGGAWTALNDISGDVEMRISNDPSFAGAEWEPLMAEKPWTLDAGPAGTYLVFAQFRDGAGNESLIVYDDIYLSLQTLYLPIVLRSL